MTTRDIRSSGDTWRFTFLDKASAAEIARHDTAIFDNGFGEKQMEAEIDAGSLGSLWVGPELVAYYLARVDHDMTDITRFAVLPDFRGKGIGKYLLATALLNIKTPRICLQVRKDNKVAQGLYRQQGFQIRGEIEQSWLMLLDRPTSS